MTNKYTFKTEQELIDAAIEIVTNRLNIPQGSESFTDPSHVAEYLLLNFEQQKHEQFGVIFLTSKHKIIKDEIIFNGGINSAQVYPRTVAQKALEYNSSCVVLYHNHPSLSSAEPSQADRDLTTRLIKTLQLIDVKVLDHFILSGKETFSMASHQMI